MNVKKVDPRVAEELGKLQDRLIDLTARNRLLQFRIAPTSTVPLAHPNPQELFDGLQSGKAFVVVDAIPEPQHRRQTEPLPLVPGGDDPAVALRAVENLRRKASQAELDTGLHILYVAFGLLHWRDEDDDAMVSPLLFVPVELVREQARSRITVRLAEDEIAVNPALALKLQEFGIPLPTVMRDEEQATLDGFLDGVRTAVAEQQQWRVEDVAHLSYFSFTKEAMYRDLRDNMALIAEHEAVAALTLAGTGDGPDLRFTELLQELRPELLDHTRPPERHPLVLDADVYQRRAIAAAVAGKSFVVEGPPGTGKSQTIANMIASLLHEGRSVLFVSEKAAALEAVNKHLEAVGLGAFVQEMHSAKAKRSEIARSLTHALQHRPHPPQKLSEIDRRAAADERDHLNRYAAAMNTALAPLGEPPIAVLRRLGVLHHTPVAPPAESIATELAPEHLQEILAAAHRLRGAWEPSSEGKDYLWHGVAVEHSLQGPIQEALAALEPLEALTRLNHRVAAALDLTRPSDAEALSQVLDYWFAKPEQLPLAWLTAEDLGPVDVALSQLAEDIAAVEAADRAVSQRAGCSWRGLPVAPPIEASVQAEWDSVRPQERVDARHCTVAQAQLIVAAIRSADETSVSALEAGKQAAMAFALPEPSDLGELTRLRTALAAGSSADRPEEPWLCRDGLDRARAATSALAAAHAHAARASAAAQRHFTRQILTIEVEALHSRFANIHTGIRKLSADYRTDKRVLAAASKPGVPPPAAIAALPQAAEWLEAEAELSRCEARYAATLGTYYAGVSTDWAALDRALGNAHRILTYAQPHDPSLPIGRGLHRTAPAGAPIASLRVLDSAIAAWQASSRVVDASGAVHDLQQWRFDAVGQWARSQTAMLDCRIAWARTLSHAIGRDVTLDGAAEIGRLREAAAAAHAEAEGRSQDTAALLAGAFNGLGTPVEQVAGLVQWARTMRRLANGSDTPIPAEGLALLDAATPMDAREASTRWHQARASVAGAFDADTRGSVEAALDHYADGRDLLTALLEDPFGQAKWFANREALSQLASYGLQPVIDFCVRQRIAADVVPDVIEKSVLAGWIEYAFASRPALRPYASADRDDLVERYRRSDRRLIQTAVSDIVEAVASRRPLVVGDQHRLIEAEGKKKRRHMPVRELLARSQDVVLAVKPVFMMSPMAVSQFLPPEIRFDAVIFDEASQVRPEDAINSIYRGRSLIVVGDEKQMPPTNFWQATVGEKDGVWVDGASSIEDFDSVLTLASGSASFETFMLQMHYRSQHESLIAFSNHSFYRGELHTFPSAQATSDSLGVAYIPAGGIYQRGTTKDNPIEAEKVVERIFHHFDTRPGQTLGVVAFSDAQKTAIELALDRAILERPDLRDQIESEDRMDGFFVKNLETVQGDERDVIIFSIGYGPDEHGKITNVFGPLNREGGWRRLNVAVTRARRRVEVVASMSAAQMPDSTTASVVHFRRYLDYAERGIAALGHTDSGTSTPESPFEESVIAAIRSWGYDAVPQVGMAGYRIDIAVRHPQHPAVYSLAVECDGYAYHSSKAARDRDRIRHNVLTGLGWTVHHIWGTAWYRFRDAEEARLREAIETAIAGDMQVPAIAADHRREVVHLVQEDLPDTPMWASPYRVVQLYSRRTGADPASPAWRGHLSEDIRGIVEAEGPIHTTVLDDRVKSHWGFKRIGPNIRENIRAAVRTSGVRVDGEFLDVAQRREPVKVRVPDADPRTQRKVDQVADSELRSAVSGFVRDSRGVSHEALVVSIARLFGWSRTGNVIQERVADAVAELLRQGLIEGDPSRLKASANAA